MKVSSRHPSKEKKPASIANKAVIEILNSTPTNAAGKLWTLAQWLRDLPGQYKRGDRACARASAIAIVSGASKLGVSTSSEFTDFKKLTSDTLFPDACIALAELLDQEVERLHGSGEDFERLWPLQNGTGHIPPPPTRQAPASLPEFKARLRAWKDYRVHAEEFAKFFGKLGEPNDLHAAATRQLIDAAESLGIFSKLYHCASDVPKEITLEVFYHVVDELHATIARTKQPATKMPAAGQPASPLIDTDEIARRVGCTGAHADRIAKAMIGSHIDPGTGKRMTPETSVNKYLANRRQKPQRATTSRRKLVPKDAKAGALREWVCGEGHSMKSKFKPVTCSDPSCTSTDIISSDD